MSRLVALIFHNWPLKLAAIVLATLLYAGLVLSRDADSFTGSVQVLPTKLPEGTVLVTNLEPVTLVRYLRSGDGNSVVTPDSFSATVDLSGVDPDAGPTFVPIEVVAVNPALGVVSWEPAGLNVQLDRIVSKTVPVQVIEGPPPENLEVRDPVVDPETVVVRGPDSAVSQVVAARADVAIDPSGIDFDRDVELIPVDALGNAVLEVDVEPALAHVTILVLTDSTTKSVAVNPIVTGTPATGFEVESVTVEPALVTVEGDADQVAAIVRADTQPISISGATEGVSVPAELALPEGVLPLGDGTVQVTITLRTVTVTRNLDAAVVPAGEAAGLIYELSVASTLVTVGGSPADLNRIDASTFTVSADVTGLPPGTHEVELEATLPSGVRLVAINPPTVTVTITSPPLASASPGPSASP